jgi:hypothetical protein
MIKVEKASGRIVEFGDHNKSYSRTFSADFVVDERHIYWAAAGTRIYRVDKATANAEPFSKELASNLVLDRGELWWLDREPSTDKTYTDLRRRRTETGQEELATRASDEASYLAVDDRSAVWVNTRMVDREGVKEIEIFDRASGKKHVIVPIERRCFPERLRLHGEHVYWFESRPDQPVSVIRRAPRSGGAAQVVVDKLKPFSSELVFELDDELLYYPHDGELFAIPLAGGTPIRIADGQRSIEALVVEPSALFWLAPVVGDAGSSGKALIRVAKE